MDNERLLDIANEIDHGSPGLGFVEWYDDQDHDDDLQISGNAAGYQHLAAALLRASAGSNRTDADGKLSISIAGPGGPPQEVRLVLNVADCEIRTPQKWRERSWLGGIIGPIVLALIVVPWMLGMYYLVRRF